MANKGSVKKVFPGGNTYKGFHSFYDYIIETDAARIFIIKGGPGVGKSSFMKHIANEFVENGYDVELHHCSSDNNSLDGLVIPAARVALIDGTAPHIVDPKNPGGVDEILNLGEYWEEEGMVKNKETIINFNKEIKGMFNSSYHYLASAKEMQDDMETVAVNALDRYKFNNFILGLKEELLGGVEKKEKAGKARHLFDSAITPEGVYDYIDTIIPEDYCCYYISGYGNLSTEVLKAVADEYLIKGYDVELYHQPLNPEHLQTLVVGELKVAITTNKKLKGRATAYSVDDNLSPEVLAQHKERINKDMIMMEILMDEAVKRIHKAKLLHDDMEKCYIPNMDFEGISKLRSKTIERIKKLLSS